VYEKDGESHFLLKKVTLPVMRNNISCYWRRKFIFAQLIWIGRTTIIYRIRKNYGVVGKLTFLFYNKMD